MQGVDFRPGLDAGIPRAGDSAPGGLICYEAVFPALARQRVRDGANVLVNISNDAWFGRTSAPVQHLYLTAMRAVETGRYIARATNTGITAIIDQRGRITTHGALFKPQVVIGEARLFTHSTVYCLAAPYIMWGTVLVSLAAAALCLARRRAGPRSTFS
jgi:apolipoprotein N-acyltransferase